MTRFLTTLILLTSFLTIPQTLFAHDSCEDYEHRHYKKDLVPQSVFFTNKELRGDIFDPRQEVWFYFKNIGVYDIKNSSGVINIRFSVAGQVMDGKVIGYVPAGSGGLVKAVSRNYHLKHCSLAWVHIDMARTAGQDGCNVFGNDAKLLQIRQWGGRSCIVPRPVPIRNDP